MNVCLAVLTGMAVLVLLAVLLLASSPTVAILPLRPQYGCEHRAARHGRRAMNSGRGSRGSWGRSAVSGGQRARSDSGRKSVQCAST